RATQVNGAHRQAAVDAEEGRTGAVHSGYLHRREAGQQVAAPGAAIACVAQAADIESAEPGYQQVEGKGVLLPIAVDHRRHLGLHEGTDLLQHLLLSEAERLGEVIEVAVWLR